MPHSPGSLETLWSLHNPAQYHAEMPMSAPWTRETMRPVPKAYSSYVAYLNMTPRVHCYISELPWVFENPCSLQ